MKKRVLSLSLVLLLLLVLASTQALAEDPAQAEPAYYQLGDRDTEDSEDISSLQDALIVFGYLADGTSDGMYGKGTAAAVKKYQLDNNLEATGSVTYDQFRGILAAAEKVTLERITKAIIDQINAIDDKDAIEAICTAALEKYMVW